MQKVSCKQCGAEVYESEQVCPKCGTPMLKTAYELRQEAEKAQAEAAARQEEESRKLKESTEAQAGLPSSTRSLSPEKINRLVGVGIAAVFLCALILSCLRTQSLPKSPSLKQSNLTIEGVDDFIRQFNSLTSSQETDAQRKTRWQMEGEA